MRWKNLRRSLAKEDHGQRKRLHATPPIKSPGPKRKRTKSLLIEGHLPEEMACKDLQIESPGPKKTVIGNLQNVNHGQRRMAIKSRFVSLSNQGQTGNKLFR